MPGPKLGRSRRGPTSGRALQVETLETRNLLAATASLTGGVLTVAGDAQRDVIRVSLDSARNQIVVQSQVIEIARFASTAVTSIVVNVDGGASNVVRIDPNVAQPATVVGGGGNDFLTGGAGPTILQGGANRDKLVAGPGGTVLDGGAGADRLFRVKANDVVVPDPADKISFAVPPLGANTLQPQILTQSDVQTLLLRASAATGSNDGIIAIVDRGGRLLGVFVESGVSANILNNPELLTFAIDGAIAKARTGAFFGNNQAPLTSRTIENLSESALTQREIEAYPFIDDQFSTLKGPGPVAPQGIRSHFPRNNPYTPQVDLFHIEYTNRDSVISPGPNRIRQAVLQGNMVVPGGDDIQLAGRFNIPNSAYRPDIVAANQQLAAPESYGFLTGIDPDGQSRGIATLPGGIPIYKFDAQNRGDLVGGIGVFYPGQTGFATEENWEESGQYDPRLPDRSFEAEFAAFAAVGGVPNTTLRGLNLDLRGLPLGGVNAIQNVGLISAGTNRIDLVGITLDVFGPMGNLGPPALASFGLSLPRGTPDGRFFQINTSNAAPVSPAQLQALLANNNAGAFLAQNTPVPDGYIVPPQDGVGISAAEVNRIIVNAVAQAFQTRAAIRLPFNQPTSMVVAVTDLTGTVVGLFRMPDSTIFSIDVAVAKARNAQYYANPTQLQAIDTLPGVLPGFALTARSFRYLGLPRFPEGIDGTLPGPFSQFLTPGVNRFNGLTDSPIQAAAFQTAVGFNAFNPQSNFHDPFNVANQNGIVFFPGSAALYRARTNLIGGFGISGDGVDQDDVVTTAGATGFEPPPGRRIDEIFVKGVRIPYNKFNRNPEGGIVT